MAPVRATPMASYKSSLRTFWQIVSKVAKHKTKMTKLFMARCVPSLRGLPKYLRKALKRLEAMNMERIGEMARLAKIIETLSQLIRGGLAISPNPRTPPIMECVVDVGIPFQVQRATKVPAASIEVKLPKITVLSGSSPISTMPRSMVFITKGPRRIPPSAANNAKRITALLMEMTPAPTAHSVGFAASFAPRFHAI
jgi:hypothetical protein